MGWQELLLHGKELPLWGIDDLLHRDYDSVMHLLRDRSFCTADWKSMKPFRLKLGGHIQTFEFFRVLYKDLALFAIVHPKGHLVVSACGQKCPRGVVAASGAIFNARHRLHDRLCCPRRLCCGDASGSTCASNMRGHDAPDIWGQNCGRMLGSTCVFILNRHAKLVPNPISLECMSYRTVTIRSSSWQLYDVQHLKQDVTGPGIFTTCMNIYTPRN